ncbi:GFA family protein [Pendulispora rubella]|uniref:GFA family protein n=2 Tax=Pendulispora rubella TaxID=2741070 RepID=A0ABZ2L5Y5_9BACT
MSLQVPRAGFRLTRGTPKWWTRKTDSGGRLQCAFCADCGSRLWHQPEGPSETMTLKGGSLDEPPDAAAAIHIWVSRKLPGIVIPEGALQFPEEPD